jgi:hypothetical protein
MDPGQNIFASKKGDIKGRWSLVSPSDDVQIPTPDCKETSVAGSFLENKVSSCRCIGMYIASFFF